MDIRSQLVQLAQAGDSAAARTLIEQNQAPVYRLALSILDDPGQARLAAQEAAVAQLENLGAYPGPEQHTAWLYRITVQVCLGRLRTQRLVQRLPARLRSRLQRPTSAEPPAAALPAPEPLFQAASRLEDALRLPLVLRYAHDLLPHEVALVLNWRDRGVQARLNQARRGLLDEGTVPPAAAVDEPQHDGLSHQRAESLLESAADYAITDADDLLLKRHLKDCARCQASARRLAALEDGLRAAFHARWDNQPLPEKPAVEILDRRRLRTARRHSFSLAGALAITVLVVGLIIGLPTSLPAQILPPLNLPTSTPLPATSTAPMLATNLPPISRQDLLAGIYPGKIAFMTMSGASDHLFTIEPKNGVSQKITSGLSENSYPAWSPDGSQIAYLAIPENRGSNAIFVANADGSDSRELSQGGFLRLREPIPAYSGTDQTRYPHYGPPRWSPDGRYLVAEVWGSNTDHFLALIPLSGRETRILPAQGLDLEYVRWSPDGNAIAYLGNSQRVLWLWQPDLPLQEGLNPRRLSSGSWDTVFGLTWSPDSNQVAILGGDREGDDVQVNLHILSKTGVEIQNYTVSLGRLTHTSFRSSQLTWSPDGRYLAMIPVFTDSDLVYGRILLIRTGLIGPVPLLSGTSAEVSGLSWSPDGRWLAYSVGHEIWAASLDAYEKNQDHLVRLTTSAGYELNWQTVN